MLVSAVNSHLIDTFSFGIVLRVPEEVEFYLTRKAIKGSIHQKENRRALMKKTLSLRFGLPLVAEED